MGFGAKMRSIRAWRGITQLELSKLISFEQQILSAIEREVVLPTPELESQIKEALDWDEALEEIQRVAPDRIQGKR